MLAFAESSFDEKADLASVTALVTDLILVRRGLAGAAALQHMSSGGKMVRSRLALHSARSLGLSPQYAIAIAAASELIHNASLVHDDIQDGAETRRGRATLCALHGRDVAICSGDLLISAAYGALARTGGALLSDAMARMHHRVSEVIAGQTADLAARNATNITLSQYVKIAAAKSAPLLGLPLELSLIVAGRADLVDQVERAASAFAIAYQMADDIEDATLDIANGEVNIVGILGSEMSFDAALETADSLLRKSCLLASQLALEIPLGCGDLMSALALDCARKAHARVGD